MGDEAHDENRRQELDSFGLRAGLHGVDLDGGVEEDDVVLRHVFIDSVYDFPHIVVPFAEKYHTKKGRNQGTHTAQLFQVKLTRSAGFPYSSSRYLIPATPGRSRLLLKRLTQQRQFRWLGVIHLNRITELS